jgi:hypothetical protein
MKRVNHLLAVLSLAVLNAAAGPETQPSNTLTAECSVDIWGYNKVEQADVVGNADWRAELITALAGPARETLHVPTEALQQYLTVNTQRPTVELGQQRFLIAVDLDAAARPAAREFLDQVIAAIPGVIAQVNRDNALRSLPEDLKQATEKRDRCRAQLATITEALGGTIGDPSVADVRDEANKLDQQRDEATIQAAAMHAEQEQLAKEILRLGSAMHLAAANDPAAVELNKIVSIKQEQLQEVGEKYAANNPDFVRMNRDLTVQLAEARVQAIEREQAVEQANGGDLLADLRKRMVQIDIDLATTAARIDVINQRVHELTKAQSLLIQAQDVQAQLDQAAKAVQEITPQLDAAEEKLRQMPAPYIRIVPLEEL